MKIDKDDFLNIFIIYRKHVNIKNIGCVYANVCMGT